MSFLPSRSPSIGEANLSPGLWALGDQRLLLSPASTGPLKIFLSLVCLNLRAARPDGRCYTMKHQTEKNQQGAVEKRIASALLYVCSLRGLSTIQKLILGIVVDAHIRGARFWPRSRVFAKQASCSPPTLYRAVKRLIPEWLTVERRPSKPAIYRPSQKLLRVLGLIPPESGASHGTR